MNDSSIFFSNLHKGFSDSELENLSKISRFEAGVAPWICWESENSSFGKTFREWAGFPGIFPLYVSSDHGVHLESRCWPNEINSPVRVFLSWHKTKVEQLKSKHGKRAYYTQHPWINYRKKHYNNGSVQQCGTLVFFPHSNAYTSLTYDLDQYFSQLKALPKKCHPIVICMSFHDVLKGMHTKIRKYEHPIITIGNTNSQYFVDRFYSTILQFKYSTSPNVGSHTFYLLEAGIPFFLLGEKPEFNVAGSPALKDGNHDIYKLESEIEYNELSNLISTLNKIHDVVTSEQSAITNKYLGADADMSRLGLAWILWRELFLNFTDFFKRYLAALWTVVRKNKFI